MNKFKNFIKESFRNHNSFFVLSSLAATAIILFILFIIMANVSANGLSLFFGGVPETISRTEFQKSVLDNIQTPSELSEKEYKHFLSKFKSEEEKAFFIKVYGEKPQNSQILGFIDENIYPRDANLDEDEKKRLVGMFSSINYRVEDYNLVKNSFYFYRRFKFNREGILDRYDESISILKTLGLKNIGEELKMTREEFEKQVISKFSLDKIDPAIIEEQKRIETGFIEELKREDKLKLAKKQEAIPMEQRVREALINNLVRPAYVYEENFVLKENISSETESKISDIFKSINFKYTSIIEFIIAEPKKGFEHGGVWQPIFGTVALVIIMTIAVVPVGVITAIYLHEYAGHGRLTRLIRLAVNNLAGVPAIVFGLFGLGFFIQFVGQGFDYLFFYDDTRKTIEFVSETDKNKKIKITHFKGKVQAELVGLDNYQVVGGTEKVEQSEQEKQAGKPVKELVKPIQILKGENQELAKIDFEMDSFLFIHTFEAIVNTDKGSQRFIDNALDKPMLLDGTRYSVAFNTIREEKTVLGQPAILWAAFTLALLTLPVVIVSTEEALSNIPNDIRAASYALGATKFQTITRLVLPNSLSGIMTGGILAVSRGAGEVAPILFTGAAYFNKDLPTKLNDQFMELGYHIFIMATQAPNIELTKPILYSTVLTLLVLTFLLNLLAIVVRFQLRAKFKSLH